MKKYVIGIDFGTLSGRAILVDAHTGKMIEESVLEYSHGVMTKALPDGTELSPMTALQHPMDYLEVLGKTVPDVMSKAGVDKQDIAGVSIDFTSCTMLPLDSNGIPMCFMDKYASEPNAYAKLWKHHSSQPQADRINKLAKERGEKWHAIYNHSVSSEWMLPKILQTLEEAPTLYEETYRFAEAGDWLSWYLTETESYAPSFAGMKSLWTREGGYPSGEFFAALDSRLGDIVGTKLPENIAYVEDIAGYVSERGAQLTGLAVGTPVALPDLDGPAALPAVRVYEEGQMMVIMGTSAVYLINSPHLVPNTEGIYLYVKDCIYNGLYMYEAGQACFGDAYEWFVKNLVPAAYYEEAKERNINIHKLLREKAMKQRIGESGLLALDWFNGNRSVLSDSRLSGMILGLTINTKPEEIYRAMIEATAFGGKMIVDTFEKNGLRVDTICATGGIAFKDEMLMQIFADVTGKRISVAGTTQGAALGSAIRAAVAGGIYPDIFAAIDVMGAHSAKVYEPIPENVKAYGTLYEEYKRLHDYFGRGENDVMKRISKH